VRPGRGLTDLQRHEREGQDQRDRCWDGVDLGPRPEDPTISTATTATLTAKLTTTGKRLRKAKRDVRVKVSFTPKNTKKAQTIYSPRAAIKMR
jgi:hypothetical protein